MTQIPAGWYPDPAPQSLPGRLRYWDGGGWTEHTHDPQPVPPSYPPAYPTPYGQPGDGRSAYAPQPAYGPIAPKPRPTTPDGQPLSGWWRRVLAVVLDGVIQVPLYALAATPVVIWQWDELSSWFSGLSDAIDNNADNPPDPAILDATSAPGLLLVLSLLVATTLYTVVFLRWKQATPGKLIVGTRIRRRDTPGPLPWSTITLRVGFVTALSLFAQVPLIGALFALAALVDYLWPLWDDKNQALHDKVARTNVVLASTDPTTSVGPVEAPTAAGLPPRW